MELKIDKKISRGFLIALMSLVVAYLLLRETEHVKAIWNFLKGIFSPFVIGAILAFILNVPVRFFEGKLSRIKNEKARRILAICLMLVAVAVVIAAVLLLLVPQIEKTVQSLVKQLPDFFREIGDWVNTFLAANPQIAQMLGMEPGSVGIEWMALVEKIMAALETSISGIVNGAVPIGSGPCSHPRDVYTEDAP